MSQTISLNHVTQWIPTHANMFVPIRCENILFIWTEQKACDDGCVTQNKSTIIIFAVFLHRRRCHKRVAKDIAELVSYDNSDLYAFRKLDSGSLLGELPRMSGIMYAGERDGYFFTHLELIICRPSKSHTCNFLSSLTVTTYLKAVSTALQRTFVAHLVVCKMSPVLKKTRVSGSSSEVWRRTLAQ